MTQPRVSHHDSWRTVIGLIEPRDPLTGQHLERMSRYTRELATALQQKPRFQPVVTPAFIELIEASARLHDIGKVGVSDRILLKPGALTADERREMQRHPLVSSECLRIIEQRLGACNFLQMAHEIALYHHERWDGQGYPQGLRGESIPLSARIVAIADVYDALSSERVYKSAFPHAQCVEMIRAGAGTQFDPELVEVFLQIQDRFQEILLTWQDDLVAQAQPQATPPGPTTSSPSRSFDEAHTKLRAHARNLDRLIEMLQLEPAASD